MKSSSKAGKGTLGVLVGAGLIAGACTGRLVIQKGTHSDAGGPDAGDSVRDSGGSVDSMGGAGGRGASVDSTGGAGGARSGNGGEPHGDAGRGAGGFETAGAGGTLGGTGGLEPSTGGRIPTTPMCAARSFGGAIATGTAGGNSDGPPVDFPESTTRWPGNGQDCPATAPRATECDAPAGTHCFYPPSGNDAGSVLGDVWCVPTDLSHKVWWGWASVGSSRCPAAQPTNAATCGELLAGQDHLECVYPASQHCWCTAPQGGGAPTWTCYDYHALIPLPVIPPAPDVSEAVNELSDAERDAWCLWFSCNSSAATRSAGDDYTPASSPISMSGLAFYRCAGSGMGGPRDGSAPAPSVEHCKANLALSSCAAPLSELTDCVTTLATGTPSPTGCGKYLARPGCSGTIVTANKDFTGDRGGALNWNGIGDAVRCTLRVE